MFGKFEHIGVAVKDLKASIPLFEKLTGSECYKQEEVESEGVITAFFKIGETKLELLQATSDDSPIAKHIEKRGEGIHHVAFAVDDIVNEMEKKREEGYRLLNEVPKNGADNKLICFIHPKDANGILVEMCQDKH